MLRIAVGALLLALACASASCALRGTGSAEHESEPVATARRYALSSIDCVQAQDTGYSEGKPFPITVVTVDGKKVEQQTANAYYVMAQAADRDGVELAVVSAFRTMAEQERLYACYVDCNCNNCNLAAEPGYSNHQSGHALDLNTSATGVLAWLQAHGGDFGFEATVASEDWHWEWWGGGPGGGPCAVDYAGESLGVSGQSYPIVSQGSVTVAVGETVSGWIKLQNVGRATWPAGTVWLAPIPRDQPSPLASASWRDPTRISSCATDVAPNEIGEFTLDITGMVEGHSILSLGWVAESVTWFADAPLGGGPEDGYFAVAVDVVPARSMPSAADAGASMPADEDEPDAATPRGGSDGTSPRDAGASAGSEGSARVGERTDGGADEERDAGDAADEHAEQSGGCSALPRANRDARGYPLAVLALIRLFRRRRSC